MLEDADGEGAACCAHPKQLLRHHLCVAANGLHSHQAMLEGLKALLQGR